MKTTKKPKRDPHDRYYTAPKLAHAITHRLASLLPRPPVNVLEPSAGTGVFCLAVRQSWPSAHIAALEPYAPKGQGMIPGSDYTGIARFEDYRTFEGPSAGYDLIIGNPPFGCAVEHVLRARTMARHVAFLLRMSFLSSQERVTRLWSGRTELRHLIPIVERPSFTRPGQTRPSGTDNSEYAVFVWERGYIGLPQLQPHLWWRTE